LRRLPASFIPLARDSSIHRFVDDAAFFMTSSCIGVQGVRESCYDSHSHSHSH